MALLFRRKSGNTQCRFKTLLDPALGSGIGHVHEFSAHTAAVGIAQGLEHVAQGHGVGFGEVGIGCRIHLIEVGFGKAIEGRIKLGNDRAILALQGIEIGKTRTQRTVGRNNGLHRHLFASNGKIGFLLLHLHESIGFGTLGKGLDDRSMSLVTGDLVAIGGGQMLQLVKVGTPLVRNRTRVVEVGLVEFFDVGGVTAKKVGIG